MSASVKPLTLEEFLAWERSQPLRYEFDGIQPVAMTGSTVTHARTLTRLLTAIGTRLAAPYEAYPSELKVLTRYGVRYPDLSVAGLEEGDGDTIEPTVIFEVVLPATALTDRRVKSAEYATVHSIQVYVLVETERPEITIRRRCNGWDAETLHSPDVELQLPEIGISIPLSAIYNPTR